MFWPTSAEVSPVRHTCSASMACAASSSQRAYRPRLPNRSTADNARTTATAAVFQRFRVSRPSMLEYGPTGATLA
jgi:hypothetical protein